MTLARDQALRGALATGGWGGGGGEKEGEPVVLCRLSCQISANQREAETSVNVNKH